MSCKVSRLSTAHLVFICGNLFLGRFVLFSPRRWNWERTVSFAQQELASVAIKDPPGHFERRNGTERPAPKPQRIPLETNWSWAVNSPDGLVLPQTTWQNWLESQAPRVSETLKSGTFRFLNKGCGFSVFLRYGTSPQRVFMKHSLVHDEKEMQHSEAETHLREIKTAYLDRILGTELTPACIGHRVRFCELQRVFQTLQGKKSQSKEELDRVTHCAKQNGTIDGSFMFFMEGLKATKIKTILSAARSPHDHSDFAESARRYAVLNYLAGCSKSTHNHFVWNGTRLVAIDNDRCFTPMQVLEETPKKFQHKFNMWERVVFRMCSFSDSFIRILEAHDGERISNRLLRALEGDSLSEALLEEQPQVFHEIDLRASYLLQHIRNCRNHTKGPGRD